MKKQNGKLLIKNASHVITCDDDDRMLENASIYINNGLIEAIGSDIANAASGNEVIDATGLAVYPGLINTHHHLYQLLTRNLPEVQNLELFDWLRGLYGIWKHLNADAVYAAVSAGLGELLLSGCTTCFDHHYVFPKGGGDLLEAGFAGAQQLGMRMVAARGSMSLGESLGGLPPDSVVQSTNEILSDSHKAIERYHDRSKGSMQQIVLAPCSPFSVTDDLMIETAKLARSQKVRLHTHLAETKDEESFVMVNTGKRPLEHMESLGWTGPDVWYAHGIHFNSEELVKLAKTGTGVAHCPASNMKLSSGVARIPEMLGLDVPVGLAVDGSASNDGSNMLDEMRIGYLLHRLTSGERAPSGYDVLKIATRGSARLLGRDDIGYIAPGMCADMFLVDESRIELSGACFDYSTVLAAVGVNGAVDHTIVNGKVVVRGGLLVYANQAQLNTNVNREAKKMLSLS